jgi:hypothetical protein
MQQVPSTEVKKVETLEWETEEYEHVEKSQDWFWVTGLIAASAVIIAIVLMNFLLAIIIVLGTSILLWYAARQPEVLKFTLTPKGLRVKNDLYPFKNLDAFWILEDKNKLILRMHRFFLPHLVIPLGYVNHTEVKDYLRRYLQEEEQEESLIDVIAERFGF